MANNITPESYPVGTRVVHMNHGSGEVSGWHRDNIAIRWDTGGTSSGPAHHAGLTHEPKPLTVDDLAAMEGDPRWDGHGYIRGRSAALASTDPEHPDYEPEAAPTPGAVEAADRRIVAIANERGWTYDQLFEWANSRDGRWFADAAIGCDDLDDAVDKWHLI
ncbi:MAG TPA: hypothetical protein VIQ30_22590 [Pseudonocardia sp.]